MRKILLVLFAGLLATQAHADFTGKNAAGTTVTFKNAVDCTSVVCIPQQAITDSTGVNFVAVLTAGADASSNTATGLLSYNRNLVYNGTTWDRWQGGIKAAAGAFAVGAGVDGWDLSTGAQTDAAVVAGAAGSLHGQIRAISRDMGTVATNSALPLPAQSNFTTNIGSVTSSDANSNAVLNDPCQTVAKTYTPINVVTATNTIVTGVSAKKKYICGIFLYPAGTTNVAIFQATTATSCATALVSVIGGTTTATGIIMTAQAGFVLGNGSSSVAATTVNQTDLCIVTSAAVQVSGVVVTVDR